MTTHCGALIPKPESKNVLLQYINYYLQNNLKYFALGVQNKRVTSGIIQNISIPIPVDSNGNFDLTAQKEIANKYIFIEKIKDDIKKQLDILPNIQIEI